VNRIYRHDFLFSDLDLITLICELDLDLLKMYLHTKNELSRSRFSEVKSITDRSTDTGRQM